MGATLLEVLKSASKAKTKPAAKPAAKAKAKAAAAAGDPDAAGAGPDGPNAAAAGPADDHDEDIQAEAMFNTTNIKACKQSGLRCLY